MLGVLAQNFRCNANKTVRATFANTRTRSQPFETSAVSIKLLKVLRVMSPANMRYNTALIPPQASRGSKNRSGHEGSAWFERADTLSSAYVRRKGVIFTALAVH